MRQSFDFSKAFKTAIGMSFISMISMEVAMNLTDYFLTGGAILTWWVVPIMLLAGFLTPWPYNYWRLKKFNIANKMMHMKHQPEMMKMVENEILLSDSIDKEKMKKMAKMDKAMGHSHSNSVLLEPNQKGEIIWKFDNAVNIEVACNVPGHYQVGMIAKVDIN